MARESAKPSRSPRESSGREAGNESGFLVGVRICHFDRAHAPRIRQGERLRMRATYDASVYRIGAMAQVEVFAHVTGY